ncbi:hypothetical protein H4Q26_000829 [Puccinia striiformis f. sp. tritici PST-130]|nr:hypothetical protein H4Q26_000829 [Puccinia striiformis f. sp. tritici PST-130]
MRKGLRSVGAGVQGTTHINRIKANTNPRRLLDRIPTNHKDIAHNEQAGNIKLVRPEGKEPDLTPSEGAKANRRKNPQPKIAIERISQFHSSHSDHQRSLSCSLALTLLHLNNETSLNAGITALSPALRYISPSLN